MPQTLTAFMALMSVLLFALSHQRATIQARSQMVDTELEIMANAIGSEVMHYIATKPFDAQTANGTVDRDNPDLSALTSPYAFGEDRFYDDCEDIDDFNEMLPLTMPFMVTDDLGFDFTVQISVRYIDDLGNESSSPTWVKEVSLSVEGPTNEAGIPFLKQPVVLKRQFSPQWF